MEARNDIISVDAMMDERFGKVGTSEREAFRKEAYAYCVGQIISDARKHEKVTQQELARRVGTNKSYISSRRYLTNFALTRSCVLSIQLHKTLYELHHQRANL